MAHCYIKLEEMAIQRRIKLETREDGAVNLSIDRLDGDDWETVVLTKDRVLELIGKLAQMAR